MAVVMLAGVSFCLLTYLVLFGTVPLTGKVVSAKTGEPVREAMVEVLSEPTINLTDWMESSRTRTDSSGNFRVRARGEIYIRVWKPGHQVMWSNNKGSALTCWLKGLRIQLREMSQTNWLDYRQTEEDYCVGDGFSFARGQILRGGSEEVDIIMREGAEGLFLEAQRRGGIVFEGEKDGQDLYTTPAAPVDGYTNRQRIEPGQDGIYFIRTSDGSHYAKLRLWKGTWKEGCYYLQWAFQPDGSRNLELKPGKNFPFPVDKFRERVE
jgi:hypothetical protein